jgi:uncharacterized alkaline shock family protein YloU
MDSTKIYFHTEAENGVISISPDVVSGIAADACIETPGVSGMAAAPVGGTRGVVVSFNNDTCCIDTFILVKNGFVIAEVAQEAQKNIKDSVEAGCGIKVSKSNVFVAGIDMKG